MSRFPPCQACTDMIRYNLLESGNEDKGDDEVEVMDHPDLETDNEFNPLKEALSLSLLPTLVLDNIIDFLDLEGRRSLRLTSKFFKFMVTRKLRFQPICSDETMEAVLQRTFPCSSLDVLNLTHPHSLSSLGDSKFTEIQTLNFTSRICGHDFVSQQNFFRLIRHCNLLTSLEISGNTLSTFEIVDKNFYRRLHLDNLRSLRLEFTGGGHRLFSINALAYAQFPQLQKLTISILQIYQQKLFYHEYEAITSMLCNHHSTIRHLQIYDYGGVIYSGGYIAGPARDGPTFQQHAKVQLQKIEIVDSYIFSEPRIPLQWTCLGPILRNQNQLQVLHLIFPSEELHSCVQAAMRSSSQTLQNIFVMNNEL